MTIVRAPLFTDLYCFLIGLNWYCLRLICVFFLFYLNSETALVTRIATIGGLGGGGSFLTFYCMECCSCPTLFSLVCLAVSVTLFFGALCARFTMSCLRLFLDFWILNFSLFYFQNYFGNQNSHIWGVVNFRTFLFETYFTFFWILKGLFFIFTFLIRKLVL